MTNKKAIEVLRSWLSVAYQNADGTDESSAELYEALQTVFNLINRQHAEITEQKEYIDRCRSGKEYWVKCLIEKPNEAVRDFAERLKENITNCHAVSDGEYVGYDWTDITHCIDDLVKEMVGAEE